MFPSYVQTCLDTLRGAGFEAYPVGGCVRDTLLGRTPGDWDVTTSALPEQTLALFEKAIPTGIQHGTVTVVLEENAIEVTTFRAEEGYADGKRNFVKDGGDAVKPCRARIRGGYGVFAVRARTVGVVGVR